MVAESARPRACVWTISLAAILAMLAAEASLPGDCLLTIFAFATPGLKVIA